MKRRLPLAFGTVLTVAAAALAVLWGPQAASASPYTTVSYPVEPAGWYKVGNEYDGKCLEGDLANYSNNGDAAQLWDCWTDPGNQKWYLQPLGNNVYKLINGRNSKCLESNLGWVGNGTPVQLWDCYNDPGNQKWQIEPYWYPGYGYYLINQFTGQCLDADLGNMLANPVRMQLWGCWNDPGNDRFSFTAQH